LVDYEIVRGILSILYGFSVFEIRTAYE
jgi:hypothetical protein